MDKTLAQDRFLEFDDVTLDLATHSVLRARRARHLSEGYWQALMLLVNNRPTTVTKEQLQNALDNSTDQTLTQQIARIREFLGDSRPWRFIKSERGEGYRWIADAQGSARTDLSEADQGEFSEDQDEFSDDQDEFSDDQDEISDDRQIDLALLTPEYLASMPKAHKTIWGPQYGLKAGIYVDSLIGDFYPWSELKPELEQRLLPQLGLPGPAACTIVSEVNYDDDLTMRPDVRIIDPNGKPIGWIRFEGDPDQEFNSCVLVRRGHHTHDDYTIEYKFERYSDGSYRRLEIRWWDNSES